MRISDFTLRNLRTFCAVTEHGGFLAAQAVLGMSQPAISAHIKDLEVSLGFPLCRRGRGGFALTEKGAEVYARAREMLSRVEDCESRLGELRQALTGHLRIGLVDSEAANPGLPVADAIRRFFSRDQDVQLTFEIGTPDVLEKALLVGDLQLAISPFPTRLPNIDYRPVYEEVHALYCGRNHPLFDVGPDAVTLAELARHPMTVRPYLRRAELAAWDAPRIVAAASNMEAQAILIASGCFLGFLPTHYARPWVEAGEMRPIDHLGLAWRSPFQVATRVRPDPPQIVRLFLQDLQSAVDAASGPARSR
ncbi:MAG TPA: LysR family transcriptional regulator [Amaricoccus sp.]|uniref:LysR family transcriptional regulator n=1 Tax=Amaricoccus sp. TaxID=1872485 RepID=UPI002CB99291|nr:LysR family transcriptional regulator [Amaricoccus sp.]HMQ92649.1 LysR family transcriptional regulator [Amaricoccus sp.]HMR53838.1 LysR family transcriptional regulator [Amaricoccus sp.]HMR61576.1 LysR family transcriptional regulator [Amaricoccus sp.]HMU00833.1 LysR family transcriptional regulator [Amaricoccus sp.]